MKSNTAYLSIGSNLGNRSENIKKCLSHISAISIIKATSSIIETEPLHLVYLRGRDAKDTRFIQSFITKLNKKQIKRATDRSGHSLGAQRTGEVTNI